MVGRHALRNALVPIFTVIGVSLPDLVGGAVITETIFSWPGIGMMMFESVLRRDYLVIMAVSLFVGIVVIAANLVTDILVAAVIRESAIEPYGTDRGSLAWVTSSCPRATTGASRGPARPTPISWARRWHRQCPPNRRIIGAFAAHVVVSGTVEPTPLRPSGLPKHVR